MTKSKYSKDVEDASEIVPEPGVALSSPCLGPQDANALLQFLLNSFKSGDDKSDQNDDFVGNIGEIMKLSSLQGDDVKALTLQILREFSKLQDILKPRDLLKAAIRHLLVLEYLQFPNLQEESINLLVPSCRGDAGCITEILLSLADLLIDKTSKANIKQKIFISRNSTTQISSGVGLLLNLVQRVYCSDFTSIRAPIVSFFKSLRSRESNNCTSANMQDLPITTKVVSELVSVLCCPLYPVSLFIIDTIAAILYSGEVWKQPTGCADIAMICAIINGMQTLSSHVPYTVNDVPLVVPAQENAVKPKSKRSRSKSNDPKPVAPVDDRRSLLVEGCIHLLQSNGCDASACQLFKSICNVQSTVRQNDAITDVHRAYVTCVSIVPLTRSAESLADWVGNIACGRLSKYLDASDNSRIKAKAFKCLCSINMPNKSGAIIRICLDAIHDTSALVRDAALDGIRHSKLPLEHRIKFVTCASDDASTIIKKSVIEILRSMCHEVHDLYVIIQAMSTYTKLMNDEEDIVRDKASAALDDLCLTASNVIDASTSTTKQTVSVPGYDSSIKHFLCTGSRPQCGIDCLTIALAMATQTEPRSLSSPCLKECLSGCKSLDHIVSALVVLMSANAVQDVYTVRTVVSPVTVNTSCLFGLASELASLFPSMFVKHLNDIMPCCGNGNEAVRCASYSILTRIVLHGVNGDFTSIEPQIRTSINRGSQRELKQVLGLCCAMSTLPGCTSTVLDDTYKLYEFYLNKDEGLNVLRCMLGMALVLNRLLYTVNVQPIASSELVPKTRDQIVIEIRKRHLELGNKLTTSASYWALSSLREYCLAVPELALEDYAYSLWTSCLSAPSAISKESVSNDVSIAIHMVRDLLMQSEDDRSDAEHGLESTGNNTAQEISQQYLKYIIRLMNHDAHPEVHGDCLKILSIIAANGNVAPMQYLDALCAHLYSEHAHIRAASQSILLMLYKNPSSKAFITPLRLINATASRPGRVSNYEMISSLYHELFDTRSRKHEFLSSLVRSIADTREITDNGLAKAQCIGHLAVSIVYKNEDELLYLMYEIGRLLESLIDDDNTTKSSTSTANALTALVMYSVRSFVAKTYGITKAKMSSYTPDSKRVFSLVKPGTVSKDWPSDIIHKAITGSPDVILQCATEAIKLMQSTTSEFACDTPAPTKRSIKKAEIDDDEGDDDDDDDAKTPATKMITRVDPQESKTVPAATVENTRNRKRRMPSTVEAKTPRDTMTEVIKPTTKTSTKTSTKTARQRSAARVLEMQV